MKKFFFFFTLITLSSLINAQDDYVEEIGKKPKNRMFSGTPNPDFTNYTFTASAYTLRKRDFRFSNTDIIFSKVSYGLTNKTTASLNMSFAGTFIGAIKHKININDGLDLGFSVSAGQALLLPEDSVVISTGGQAILTLGDHQNNFTIGSGFYYAESNFDMVSDKRQLYLNNLFVATQQQIRPKTYLIAEGMYFWNYNSFVGSVALKFIIKTRMSLLVGLMPIYRDGRISPNRSSVEGGVIPVISFRMWLDRH